MKIAHESTNAIPLQARSAHRRTTLRAERSHRQAPRETVAFRDVIQAPERIREVTEALVRNGYRTKLRGAGFAVSATPVAFLAESNELLWKCEGAVPAGVVTAEVQSYNSIYELTLRSVEARGELFATPLPERITQLRRRRMRRAEAPTGATVSYTHPVWPDQRITRPLRDFSPDGLSFFSDAADVLGEGQLLTDVEVSFTGRASIKMDLEIRQIARSGMPFYGAHAILEDAEAAASWRQLNLEVMHPRIRRGTRYAREIWDLYQRAGYFGLSAKVPEQFTKLEAPFMNVVKRLESAPELGCHVAWQTAEGKTEATMAILKTYSASSLIFQLAKVSGNTTDGMSSREVLRDVAESCYEHAQSFDGNLRWMTVLLQVKKVWSRCAYYDFPKRLDGTTDKVCIVRNHVYEVPTQGWRPGQLDGVEISAATQAEANALMSNLEQTRPVAYRESQDFTRWTMDLGAIKGAWSRAGLSRNRHMLAARKNGKVVAVAVLESADEGMHLFRLLDAVRVFSLEEGGERAFAGLIGAAQEWYRALGRDAFTCFLETDRPLPPAEDIAALVDMGQADFVVLAADMLTEQLEHIHEITAPQSR